MRVNFNEWVHGAELMLTPETLEELNELARFVLNAKKEPPSIRLTFDDDSKPYCYIYFANKRHGIAQFKSIHAYKK